MYTPPSSLYTEKPERVPKPKPSRALTTGANPRGVAIVQKTPKLTINDKAAVVGAFHSSSAATQRHILQGAINKPDDPLSKFIISYVKQQKSGSGAALDRLPAISAKQLGAATRASLRGSANLGDVLQNFLGDSLNAFERGSGLGSKVSKTATTSSGAGVLPGVGTVTPFGGAAGAEQLLKNTGKDAWGYIPQTLEGGYGLLKDVATGHEGNAAKMLIDPFVQLAEHPAKSFYDHPLDTALMFLGPKAIVGKGIAGLARRGAFGEDLAQAASTAREPLHLGTVAGERSPITEARSYSPDAIDKAIQRAREKIMEKRGRDPHVAHPKPELLPNSIAHALRVGVESKLRRIVDEEVSTRQGLGRATRARVTRELRKRKPSKEAADVVGHVLQGVIRRPDTAIEDASKEITRLKAAQTERGTLPGRRTHGEIWNRKQIQSLQTAIDTPGALDEAMGHAAALRPIIHSQDTAMIAKALLEPSRAQRARLFPYAIAHMGAKFEHEAIPSDEAVAFKAAVKAEKAAKKHVGDTELKLAEARGRTKAAIARQQGIEAARRERGLPTDRPLRKATYERIDRLQRQEHAAEDAHKLAKRARNSARANRKDLAEHKNATVPASLRYADGSPLPTQDILDHLEKNDVPDPAFVGHYPGKARPGAFYQAYQLARGQLGQRRTGEAFRSGHYDHTYEGLVGQVATRSEKLSNAHLHDRIINRLGITMKPELIEKILKTAGISDKNIQEAIQTGSFTAKEARLIARAASVDDHGNDVPGALKLTPISRAPRNVLDQVHDLQHPQELQNMSDVEMRGVAHAVEEAAGRKESDTTRNVALIPEHAASRLKDQFARQDGLLRNVGKVTQQFRRTVLPYSTHWMLQIGTEAGIRSLLAGTLDPRYLADGRRLMDRLQHTEAGRAALHEMTGATFYNKHDPHGIFNPELSKGVAAVKSAPGLRTMIAMHNRYADTIGHAMGSLERQARIMGLGKFAHQEALEFSRDWRSSVLLQRDALEQLATKMETDPALVAKLGRKIDDTFGQYSKFTPKQRAMIQSFMPFMPWYLTAARYVLWQLPAKHPVSSALLASLRQTMNQDVADGKKEPLNVWAMQELARLTPFGIFTPDTLNPSLGGVERGQQLTSAVLPELMGTLREFGGQNAFGTGPLKEKPTKANYKGDVPPGSTEAVQAGLEGLLESFFPAARLARDALAGGRSTYGTSTLVSPQPKPHEGKGSAGQALNRILNPLYAFEAAQKYPTAPELGQKAKKKSSLPSYGSGGFGLPKY